MQLLIQNNSHAIPPTLGQQTVLQIPDPLVHLKFTSLADTSIVPGYGNTSLGMLNRIALLPMPIEMLHNLLLQFFLPVTFYQFYQLLLLIVRSISQNLYISLVLVILRMGCYCCWYCVAKWIVVDAAVVAGRSGVKGFVHAPGEVDLGFGQHLVRKGVLWKPYIFLPRCWMAGDSLKRYHDICYLQLRY